MKAHAGVLVAIRRRKGDHGALGDEDVALEVRSLYLPMHQGGSSADASSATAYAFDHADRHEAALSRPNPRADSSEQGRRECELAPLLKACPLLTDQLDAGPGRPSRSGPRRKVSRFVHRVVYEPLYRHAIDL